MEVLANVVVVLHLAFFLFVVGGFAAILIGLARRWPWIYNPWFRAPHILAVMVVLAEDVFHFACPLNTMESALRPNPANADSSSGISHVLDFLLRHTIPGRVLDAMYWTLGAVLLILLLIVRPRFHNRVS
jgi:hypothetical protein